MEIINTTQPQLFQQLEDYKNQILEQKNLQNFQGLNPQSNTIYNDIYQLCLNENDLEKDIYNWYIQQIKLKSQDFLKILLNQSTPELYIKEFTNIYENIKMIIYHLSKSLAFLNNYYLKIELNLLYNNPHILKTQGFKIFISVFSEVLKKELPQKVSQQLTKRRFQDFQIQKEEIKQILKMYKVLSTQNINQILKITKKQNQQKITYELQNFEEMEENNYYNDIFFEIYKKELGSYYDEKRKEFLQGSSIDYIKNALKCLEFEDSPCEFIVENDRLELIKVVENQLIDRALHQVIQNSDGLKYILDNKLHKEAQNLYSFLNRNIIPKTQEQKKIQQNYMEILGNEFQKYVMEKAEVVCSLVLDKQTNQVIPNVENQLKFIPEFLNLYNDLTPLINDYFQSSQLFFNKRDSALTELLNRNEKFYYIFAQYCDQTIKTNAEFLEKNIDFFEQFISYFQEKSLIVRIYSRFYNNRLLNNQISNNEIENKIIESMKKVLGFYQIKTILNMQEDNQTALDLNQQIKDQIIKENLIANPVLDVKYLRQQIWPLKNIKSEIKLPPHLKLEYDLHIQKFKSIRKDQIYKQSLLFQGVKAQDVNVNLNWQYGTAELFFKSSKTQPTLIISSLQLVILSVLDFYTTKGCYIEKEEKNKKPSNEQEENTQIEEEVEENKENKEEEETQKPQPKGRQKKNTKKPAKGKKAKKSDEIEIEENKKPKNLKRKASEYEVVIKKVNIDPKEAISVEELAELTNFNKDDIQIAITPLEKMTILKKITLKSKEVYQVNEDFALKKKIIKVPTGKKFNNLQNEDEKDEQEKEQQKKIRNIETQILKIVKQNQNITLQKVIKNVGESLKEPTLEITQVTNVIKDLNQKEFIKHDEDTHMISYIS